MTNRNALREEEFAASIPEYYYSTQGSHRATILLSELHAFCSSSANSARVVLANGAILIYEQS
jgi:hypothetical protein